MQISHGLKSFSTLARLGLWGMVESGVSCRILGAGQHLHLFSTVSGLEKTLWVKASEESRESLLPERAEQGNGPITKTLNLVTKVYEKKVWTVLTLPVKSHRISDSIRVIIHSTWKPCYQQGLLAPSSNPCTWRERCKEGKLRPAWNR